MNYRRALLIVVLLVPAIVYCQLPLTRDSVENLLVRSPAFTIFNDNYFITGIPLNEAPTRYNSDVRFQLSFKQRLMDKPVWLGFYAYLGYTQKSFWDIYLQSRPFAETNYNPGMFFIKPFYKNGYLNGSICISFEHESNGRTEENGSKSWNYVAANYSHAVFHNFMASVKVWIPFGLSDNPDLMDYIGYGEVSGQWSMIENRLTAGIAVRKGAVWDWKGSVLADIKYKPFKSRNQYLMLQWSEGYAESLIDYREKHSMLRIGLVLRPTVYRFY
jgi:phospholipase A1